MILWNGQYEFVLFASIVAIQWHWKAMCTFLELKHKAIVNHFAEKRVRCDVKFPATIWIIQLTTRSVWRFLRTECTKVVLMGEKIKINRIVFIFRIDNFFCTFDMKHPLKFYLLLRGMRKKKIKSIAVIICESNRFFPFKQTQINWIDRITILLIFFCVCFVSLLFAALHCLLRIYIDLHSLCMVTFQHSMQIHCFALLCFASLVALQCWYLNSVFILHASFNNSYSESRNESTI